MTSSDEHEFLYGKDHQKNIADAANHVQFTPVDIKSIKTEECNVLVQKLKDSHQLDGASEKGDPPVLLLRLKSKKIIKQLNPEKLRVFVWGWAGTLGCCLRFQFLYPGVGDKPSRTSVYIHRNNPVFPQLKEGRFLAYFAFGKKIVAAFSIEYKVHPLSEKFFNGHWNAVNNHSPIIDDPNGFFWEIVRGQGKFNQNNPEYTSLFNLNDRLSVSWVSLYENRIKKVGEFIQANKNTFSELDVSGLDLCQHTKNYLEHLKSNDWEISSGYEFISKNVLEIITVDFITDLSKLYNLSKFDNGSTIPRDIFCLYLRSSQMTQCGIIRRWLDGYNMELGSTRITPEQIIEEDDIDEYWFSDQWDDPLVNLGLFIEGKDISINPSEIQSGFEGHSLGCSLEEADNYSKELLNEACLNKKWTIPNGAIVALDFGPFSSIECYETCLEIVFIFRNKTGKYYFCSVDPEMGTFKIDLPFEKEKKQLEKSVRGEIKILLSAIIRDFHVVEEREKTFSCKLVKDKSTEKRRSNEFRYIYLPRIKYISNPNVGQLINEFNYTGKAPHPVVGHLRQLPVGMNPSAVQMVLAEQYGISLPKNCTFVGPYNTGRKPKEKIFISRSAIKCLYQTIEYPEDNKLKPDWFKFERDVYTLMKKLKYSVAHTALSRNGDNGMDVYAKKGKTEWVIQCKCWSPRYPVGPNIIRELIGTLSDHPDGRGMVVTTSSFSSGAIRKAAEKNIDLIDGNEFISLVGEIIKK
jgi:hypothetical protein